MWSFSRRDDQLSPHLKERDSMQSDLREGAHMLIRGPRKAGVRLRKSNRNRLATGKSETAEAPLNIVEMNVNETKHGIEVSLDLNKVPESREPPHQLREPVISIKEQIRQRQKVYRTQFSVSFPALQQTLTAPDVTLDNWRPKDHRIPLLGFSLGEVSYEDVFNILQNSQLTDEYSAVQEELKQMDSEIDALDKDRTWLESSWRKMTNSLPSHSPSKNRGSFADWDVRKILNAPSIHSDEQCQLQKTRGLCLTIHLQNPRAKEAFLSKCGSKIGKNRGNKRKAPGDTVTLGPDNCRPGGAGSSVQHVSIMSNGTGSNSAFFLSRDTGKSFTWGRLPPKLFRRMKEEGRDSSRDGGDLVYLSTGPRGCYYAEFRSGECWWGSAVEDHDFHSIIQAWDVYRVVFGPILVFEDERGNKKITNSWIILGRDGRAAWKNLPSRLHHRLESRLANWAAPAEIALGPGDSYYIRFLDGTVDYCLPAVVAEVCEHIEKHGGSITNIALHPEISHDFVIRHTELKS